MQSCVERCWSADETGLVVAGRDGGVAAGKDSEEL